MREKTRLVLTDTHSVEVVPVLLDTVQIRMYPASAWETRLWTGGSSPKSILFKYQSEENWRHHFDWLRKSLFWQENVTVSRFGPEDRYIVDWELES